MGLTEFYVKRSIWSIGAELLEVLMKNMIMIVLMMSSDRIVVQILVGWVVIVS